MPTVEERLAHVEGRVEHHTGALGDVKSEIRDLRSEMRDLRTEMVGMRAELRGDIHRLEDKTDRHFRWLIGIQITGLLAVIGAMTAALYR